MPAGSGERSLYPSAGSWLVILDALTDAFPEIEVALIGKLRRDTRTTTSLAPGELAGAAGASVPAARLRRSRARRAARRR